MVTTTYENMSKEELIRELWKEKAKNSRKFLRLNTNVEIWEGYNTLVICNTKTGDRAYYNRERRIDDNWYASYREEYPEAKSVKEIRELENKRGNYFNPSEIYGCNGYKRLRATETSLEDEIRKKIELLRDEYNYSAYRLGIDLKNISDRDYTVRCSLEKVVDDLEKILK